MGTALTDMLAKSSPRLEAMEFHLQRVSTYGAEFIREGNLCEASRQACDNMVVQFQELNEKVIDSQ